MNGKLISYIVPLTNIVTKKAINVTQITASAVLFLFDLGFRIIITIPIVTNPIVMIVPLAFQIVVQTGKCAL